ncbi:AAA-like domain-containing protein [Calothrix sp. FACHB-1219]|nr:AAA-like domain-containing protein [Calothrix sp. FACHB-168]MBD2218687.1 AAA-like domain-containing protein [Calothrix sp. FACHB-1219]
MPNNPFTVGQPVSPEKFVGRTTEISAALDQIYNHGSLAIWGGPGMGKSSFLEKLAAPQYWEEFPGQSSKAVIVLLSCQTIQPFNALNFWREVLTILKDELHNEPNLQADIEKLLAAGQTTKDSLRQVLQKLGQQKKFLVLLLDDYDAALYPNEQYTEADMETFLSECRSLAYHARERKHLAIIVTSLKRLNEIGPKLNPNASPWYNHYLFQSLKPFTNHDFDQLLQHANLSIEPQLKEAIREITGGHPTLLQIACSLLYREVKKGEGTILDVTAFAQNFESDTKQIFQNIWDRCSEVEQTLLMLMALSGLKGRLHKKIKFDMSDIDLIFTQKVRELTNLEEQGVITRTKNTNGQAEIREYSFTSSIMERWVIQEIWNTNETALQQRKKVFLNLMSHQQLEKFTTDSQWLWQHKDEIPTILEWFGKISAALPKGAIKGLINWNLGA